MISITYQAKDIPKLLEMLRKAEANACGFDDKARRLINRLARLHNVSEGNSSITITEDELKGLIL